MVGLAEGSGGSRHGCSGVHILVDREELEGGQQIDWVGGWSRHPRSSK